MQCYACACRQAPYVHGYPAAAFIDYVPVLKSHYESKEFDLFFESKDKYDKLKKDVKKEIQERLSKPINLKYTKEILSVLSKKISEAANKIDTNYKNFSDTMNEETKKKYAENFGYKYMLLMQYIWIIEQIAQQIPDARPDVQTAHTIHAEKKKLKKESDITDYWTQNMKYAFESVSRLCADALLRDRRGILFT